MPEAITRGQFVRAGILGAMGLLPGRALRGAKVPEQGQPKGRGGGHTPLGGARLSFFPIELSLRHAWTLSRNTSKSKRNYVVELRCDGVTGLGEAAPNVRFGETPESVAEALARAAHIVSELHPSLRVEIVRRLARGLAGSHAARCAVDMALWDWQLKSLGVPLWRWLGLDPQAAPLTSFSLAIAGREELIEKVREAREFPLLKVKLGARGDTTDREIINTIREAAPDKRLRVDPNEGWTLDEAREKLDWLAGLGVVELCEQPLPAARLAELRALHRMRPAGLPILLDESVLSAADLPALAGAADGIVIKLQKAGGISGALDQITVARALGLKVMLGCMIESSIGITAGAHLAPLCDYVDLDGNLLISNDPYVGVAVRAGRLSLPDRPGIGVEKARNRAM